MRPTKIWANLAVKDVARTMEFYTTLGFKPNGGHTNGKDLASFLVGENDFVVHFFREDKLEEALNGKVADLGKGNEVIFTLWAESREEADLWAKEVRKAGGTVFVEPAEFGEAIMALAFQIPMGISGMCFTCDFSPRITSIKCFIYGIKPHKYH